MTRFFKIRALLQIFIVLLVSDCFAQDELKIVYLKTVYQENLISLELPLSTDDTLFLYTDTGGKNYLYKTGIKKLGINKSRGNLWSVDLSSRFTSLGIPLPYIEEFRFIRDKAAAEDGMLGREWFAGGIWHFDYQNKRFAKIADSLAQALDGETVEVYFKKDSLGNHTDHLPRIEIGIDGEILSFLFDSGAQAFLSDEAQTHFGTNEKVAVSFIQASQFEKWHSSHPDWKTLEGGDHSFGSKADIIIVPSITIGTKEIGPIAFAKREDINFEIMSERFMDKKIIGALGGNALSQINKFILNYPEEYLRFLR